MISTFSMPGVAQVVGHELARRAAMSGLCSGSVLMLGMRRKSFSSSRNRSRFTSMNALVLVDMVFLLEKNHYRASSYRAAEAVFVTEEAREQALDRMRCTSPVAKGWAIRS